MADIYMQPEDWQTWKYEAEIACPHCKEGTTYYSYDNFFNLQTFVCDFCGKGFTINCEC